MRVALSIIFSALVVVLAVFAFFAFRSKKSIGKAVGYLVLALIPPIVGNLLIISAPIEALSTVGCYFFFIGLNLVMGAFTYFTFEYCEIKWHKKLIICSITCRINGIHGKSSGRDRCAQPHHHPRVCVCTRQ